MRSVSLTVAAALAALLPAAEVSAGPAAPREAESSYRREAGAERCLDEAALRRAVVARLGRDPFREGAALQVSVRVATGGDGVRARIELSGSATGARDLSSPRADCRELGQTLALAISLAVDPFALALDGPATPEPAPAAPPPPPLSPPLPAADAERPPLPRRPEAPAHRVRLRLALGALAGVGAVGGVTFGLTAEVGLAHRWWSISIGAHGDLPATEPTTGQKLTASLVYGSLLPCVHFNLFLGCGELALGAEVASAEGLGRADTFYVAAGPRLGLEIPWGLPLSERLAFRLFGNLLFTLHRPDLTAAGLTVGRLPAMVGGAGVALVAWWP